MALPEFKKNTFDFKGLFLLKFGANKQSMAWDERGHEDGLNLIQQKGEIIEKQTR